MSDSPTDRNPETPATRTGLQADVIVIGAGLSGSAVARALSAGQGPAHSVIVVDRDIPASAEASSHGSARIFRYSYPDPLYTSLVVESRKGWDDLEQQTGRRLITPSGSLDFGTVRDPAALARVLSDAGVEHELLTVSEASDRWPGIVFDTTGDGDDSTASSPVLWHPGAGVIDAESTVHAQLDLARRTGDTLVLDHWEAASVRRRTGAAGYTVTSTTGDVLEAGQVVIAAGGWVADITAAADLPSAFLHRLPVPRVSQENAYHFPYRDSRDCGRTPEDAGTTWPTFIQKSRDTRVYSLPGGRDAGWRGQKIAEYNAGRKMRSASLQDGRIDPENRRRMTGYVTRHLPGLVPEPYAETTCLFTNLPGENFLIDRADGITVVSPCSGHGAKFAPLIGELAAGLVTGTGTVPDLFRVPGNTPGQTPGHTPRRTADVTTADTPAHHS